MVTLRRKEIYRYLGFRNTQPPEDIVQRVETCVEEMERAAVFRTTHKRFPVTITAPNTVETAGLTIYSKHLYKNLSGGGLQTSSSLLAGLRRPAYRLAARLFPHSATSQDLRYNLDGYPSHGAVQIGYSLYRLYERNTRKGRIRILSRRSEPLGGYETRSRRINTRN